MDNKDEARRREDEYFARQEFDRRKKAEEEKWQKMAAEERERQKELHWMHCPKCGSEMVEIDYEGSLLDKCTHCLGVYFDNGELEHMLEKQKGFARKLFGIFKD
jgi:Zn-finger nucleic acid-binding protein